MTDAIVRTSDYLDVAYSASDQSAIVKTSQWLDVSYTNTGIAPFKVRSYAIEVVRSKAALGYFPSPIGSFNKTLTTYWHVLGYAYIPFATGWRTAYAPPKGYIGGFILGARNGTSSEIEPLFQTAEVEDYIGGYAPSEAPIMAPTIPPNENVGEIAHAYGDVYNRVWVIPPVLNFLNPELGAETPFVLWSAWNVKNTITSIAITGTPAIALDRTTPIVMQESGSKIFNAIISDDAYPEIESLVVFNFDHGTTKYLQVTAQLLLFDRKIPDATVEEQYNWLTNILTSYNGTEQRISVRGAPRRIVNATFRLETDDQIQRFQELIYKGNDSGIGVPMWQYASGLQNDVNIGTNIFEVDLAMTDVRPGDAMLVVDLIDDTNFAVFTVGSVSIGSITALVTSTRAFKAGHTILVPLMVGKIQDSSQLKIDTVWGETSLTVEESTGHDVVSRPNTPGDLVTYYDSYPVLDKLPLNTANITSTINSAELIDYDVGKSVKKVNWTYPKLAVTREYVVERLQTVNQMDYWKEFMQAINGSQKPFLMRTFGNDLEIDPASVSFTNSIVVLGKFYGERLFQRDSHKRLVFHTDQGEYYRKVISVLVDTTNKKTTLNLDEPLPNSVTQNLFVEYLIKMRLTNDQIILTHDVDESILALSGITVEQ